MLDLARTLRLRSPGFLLLAGALVGGPAHAVPFDIELNTTGTLYGNPPVNQLDVDASNGAGGVNSCAPASVANSLAYLTNAFPNVYGNSLLQDKASAAGPSNPQPNTNAGWTVIATQLASTNYMSTDVNTGTTVPNWISGTVNYIDNNAPGTTMFESDLNPSANEILSLLQNKEDVEIAISPKQAGIAHVLTVSSVMGATNAVGAVTSMTIDGIDPADPSVEFSYALGNLNGLLNLTYGGLPYTMRFALAESPVPEPASLTLLCVAVAGMWLARRRRQA